MMGHVACFRPTLRVRLEEDLEKKPGRLHFVRVRLERRGGEIFARSTGNQSSGVMSSLGLAHGLLVFPAAASVLARGDEATVQLLDEDFLAGRERGF